MDGLDEAEDVLLLGLQKVGSGTIVVANQDLLRVEDGNRGDGGIRMNSTHVLV